MALLNQSWWNMIFTDYWKVLVCIFSGMGNAVFFEPKSWWKDGIYWLLKRPSFELFGEWKYSLFLSQEVDRKMMFTGYWEVLVLNLSGTENTVFFSAKELMERWYLLGLFEISMIFQGLRNMVFRAVSLAGSITFSLAGFRLLSI